jgi:predicted ester cyclase
MLTKEAAHRFAEHWITAWNAHDLDRIMAHYETEVELSSPVAAQILNDPQGRVVGKANLRACFQKGLAAYPELHFELLDVIWGVNSIVLYYANQKGTHTGEYMELSPRGKVLRVAANYSD